MHITKRNNTFYSTSTVTLNSYSQKHLKQQQKKPIPKSSYTRRTCKLQRLVCTSRTRSSFILCLEKICLFGA